VAGLDYIDGIITQGPFAGFDLSPERLRSVLDETEAVTAIPQNYGKPLIATAMRWHAPDIVLDLLTRAGIPYYTTPEESARAMYGLMRYGEIRQRMGEP